MNGKNDFGGIERQLKKIVKKLDNSIQDIHERQRHDEKMLKWNMVSAIFTILMAFGTIITVYLGMNANLLQEQKDTTVLFPGTAQNTGDNSMIVPLLNQYSTSNRAIIECINIEIIELYFYPSISNYTTVRVFPSVNVTSCGQYININTTFPNETSSGLLNKEFYYNYLLVDNDKPTNLEIYYAPPYPQKINDHSIIISIPQLLSNTSKIAKINISYHPANNPKNKKIINFEIFFGEEYNQPTTLYDNESDNFNINNQKILALIRNDSQLNNS